MHADRLRLWQRRESERGERCEEGRAGEGGARQPARTPDYWSERPRTCVMLRPPLWPRILERLVWKISVLLGALGELVASRGARARSGAGSPAGLLLPACCRAACRAPAGCWCCRLLHRASRPQTDTRHRQRSSDVTPSHDHDTVSACSHAMVTHVLRCTPRGCVPTLTRLTSYTSRDLLEI